MSIDADKERFERAFSQALERLRVRHLSFRLADPEEIRELEAMRIEVIEAEAALDKHVLHVAHLRLRLMERAYFVLRLVNFANAPENQGWMGLFRTWSREDIEQRHYNALAASLAPEFRRFYIDFICGCPEKDVTYLIPHPWLKKPDEESAVLFMDTGRTEPPLYTATTRPGAGGETDNSGPARADKASEVPSGAQQQGPAGVGSNE